MLTGRSGLECFTTTCIFPFDRNLVLYVDVEITHENDLSRAHFKLLLNGRYNLVELHVLLTRCFALSQSLMAHTVIVVIY